MQTTSKRYAEEHLQAEEQIIFQKELMYWEDASFNRKKANGTHSGKIIIETIDKRAKKVIFINENDKNKCTVRNPQFPNEEWQNLLYHVDVQVMKVQDAIKEYKILQVYDDVDTFEN
jgi:hypothetical protein